MQVQKEKLLRIFGYAGFAVAAFLIFFYLTFPVEALERQVLKRVEAQSGCRVKIAHRRLAIPLQYSGRGITASCPRRLFGGNLAGRLDLKLATLDLNVSPLPLVLKRQAKVAFQAELGGGTLTGNISIMRQGEGLFFDVDAIDGKQMNLVEAGLGAGGRLSLTGKGSWLEKDPMQGNGQLRIMLEDGRFSSIGAWRVPIGEVTFSKAAAQLSWKDGRIVFDQFSAQSEMGDLQGERGSLILRQPIDASLLTFSFRAAPKGNIKEMAMLFVQGYDGRDPLKVRINGALRNPQLLVNGRTVPLGT